MSNVDDDGCFGHIYDFGGYNASSQGPEAVRHIDLASLHWPPFYQQEERLNNVQFAVLCDALTRNNPNVTNVVNLYGRPYGKGMALGRALQDNTQVSHLKIPAGILGQSNLMISGDDLEQVLAFVRHSPSLRRFQVVAGVTMDSLQYESGFWTRAAAENEHIKELLLDVDYVYPEIMEQFLSAKSSSLVRLRLPFTYRSYDNYAPLFQALAGVSTLETLELYCIPIGRPEHAATMIRHFPCPNVTNASVALSFHQTPRPADVWPIVQAVSAFMVQHNGSSGALVAITASTVATAPALSKSSLQSSPPVPLQRHGRLVNFSLSLAMDGPGMQCLVDALSVSPSLLKLTLHRCIFTPEAADMFVVYMQEQNGVVVPVPVPPLANVAAALEASTTAVDNESNGQQQVGIQCLRVQSYEQDQVLPVARIIAGPRGSGLKALQVACTAAAEWHCWEDLDDFVDNQSCRLQHLTIEHLDGNDDEWCDELIQQVPHLTYLRRLELVYKVSDREIVAVPPGLLRAVKRNGSLHDVVFRRSETNSSRDVSLWTPRQARLVHAYGQRNHCLPQLLKNPYNDRMAKEKDVDSNQSKVRSSGDNDEMAADATTIASGAGLTTDAIPQPPTAQVVEFPHLLQTAMSTPRLALHHVLMGVAALKDSTGPGRPSSTLRTSLSKGA